MAAPHIPLRDYNVDPTGAAHVLPIAPLMQAQGKAFAAQMEASRSLVDTAQRGMQFVEDFGARQQLGRVKTAVSSLDPNDPQFAQKYASVVLDNPLAFTNNKTSGAAQFAVKALASERAKQQDLQLSQNRLATQFEYQKNMAGLRYENQLGLIDARTEARPARPAPWSWLPGVVPQQQPGAPPATQGPSQTPPSGQNDPSQTPPFSPDDLPPLDEPVTGGPSSGLLPPLAAASPVIEGEGDGGAAPILQTPYGPGYIDQLGPQGPSSIKILRPMPKPDPIDGYEWVPKTQVNGVVTDWERVPEKEKQNPSGLTDAEARQRAEEVAEGLTVGLKEQVDSTKEAAKKLRSDGDAKGAQEADFNAAVLEANRRAQSMTLTDHWTERYQDNKNAFLNEQRVGQWEAEGQPGGPGFVGPMQPPQTATAPAPVPSMAPDQIPTLESEESRLSGNNEAWTAAKVDALKPIVDAARKGGVDPRSVLLSITSGDSNRALQFLEKQGSPLVRRSDAEGIGHLNWSDMATTPDGRKVEMNQMIRMAMQDQNVLRQLGLSSLSADQVNLRKKEGDRFVIRAK